MGRSDECMGSLPALDSLKPGLSSHEMNTLWSTLLLGALYNSLIIHFRTWGTEHVFLNSQGRNCSPKASFNLHSESPIARVWICHYPAHGGHSLLGLKKQMLSGILSGPDHFRRAPANKRRKCATERANHTVSSWCPPHG